MSQDSVTASASHSAPPGTPGGLAAFLRGLIDYAGLFPPSRLPLEEALPNFAAYRQTPDAWMLGRFICPAARLADLEPFTDLFRPDAPFPISVLGASAPDADGFLRGFAADMRAAADFERLHEGRARAELYETRFPEPLAEKGEQEVSRVLGRLGELTAEAGVQIERVYLEVAFTGSWRRTVGESIAAFARHSNELPVGFKIRCGGLTPDAFPTPEQVAFVLAQCRDARIPFKATAGLHHPVRHYNRELEVVRHGFLNVFGAGVLAHALDLTEQALRQVIRCEQLDAFSLDDEGFGFQDLRISASQVRTARQALAHSYGSCSFDEPREDLRAAGLL